MEEVKLKTYEEWLDYYKDSSKEEVIKQLSDILRDYADVCNDVENLQHKVDEYENPDDMTLFYMWLDTKAKDKLKAWETNKEEVSNYIKKCLTTEDKLDLDAVLITIGTMLGVDLKWINNH